MFSEQATFSLTESILTIKQSGDIFAVHKKLESIMTDFLLNLTENEAKVISLNILEKFEEQQIEQNKGVRQSQNFQVKPQPSPISQSHVNNNNVSAQLKFKDSDNLLSRKRSHDNTNASYLDQPTNIMKSIMPKSANKQLNTNRSSVAKDVRKPVAQIQLINKTHIPNTTALTRRSSIINVDKPSRDSTSREQFYDYLFKEGEKSQKVRVFEQQKMVQELQNCTFKPAIIPLMKNRSNSSLNMNHSQKDRSFNEAQDHADVHNRLYQKQEEIKQKKEQLKSEFTKHDLRECTFQPNIGKKPEIRRGDCDSIDNFGFNRSTSPVIRVESRFSQIQSVLKDTQNSTNKKERLFKRILNETAVNKASNDNSQLGVSGLGKFRYSQENTAKKGSAKANKSNGVHHNRNYSYADNAKLMHMLKSSEAKSTLDFNTISASSNISLNYR
ncbi:UNKNOWN [Stylonychia lemnae]|uniref:Uncharacterized protein n=1 Tax=Stylonychia lemnae TaxID=5949 RepID=A0A078ANP3_STYLE|nr:UNKNOWN [Stylonychia lemnae]|eukprot:CDW83965.1 UNKNOWN [Stylonychia lemnae]